MEQKPFVVFGTPSLYGDVDFPHERAVIETTTKLTDAGIGWAFILTPGDPYLSKVRNNIATRFLREYPQGTHLFFIDADLGWSDPDAVIRFLKRDSDVMAGIYPKKSDPPEFPCELCLDAPLDGKLIEEDGWYKANAVPTGFLCIKRHVLEKMALGRGVYRDLDGKLKHHIFQMGLNTTEPKPVEKDDPIYDEWVAMGCESVCDWWGEDYAFCRQWREMGGEIWVWPDIDFSHTGRKSWKNNFSASVKAFNEGRAVIRDAKKELA